MAATSASVRPDVSTAVVSTRSSWRWTVVGLLTIASVIAYIDRGNLAIALADNGFQTFFNLSSQDRGWASSAFFWSYAALQIPAGWLADRYGTRLTLAVGFITWSLISAATALTTWSGQLLALRFGLGVGEAIIHPASMRWIRLHFPEKQRGFAIGVFMSGSKFGPAIGAVSAAWLIEQFGWRVMFAILGLGSLLWVLPWLAIARDHTGSASSAALPNSTPNVLFRTLVRSPILIGTVLGTFCYMYFVYFALTWMPAYLKEARSLSLMSSSVYTMFSFAGMAVVAILGGWAADRLIRAGRNPISVRKGFTLAGFLLASTEVVGAMSSSLEQALFFSVFSLSGLGLATANYWALTQTLMPSAAIGRIVGVQNCAASVAGIVAPILTGWLVSLTGGYKAPMQAMWLFLLMGLAAYVFLVREKYAWAPAGSGTPKERRA